MNGSVGITDAVQLMPWPALMMSAVGVSTVHASYMDQGYYVFIW